MELTNPIPPEKNEKTQLLEMIHQKFNEKVYWDEPTDKLLILARTYCFWLFHETYPEYKQIKAQIKLNKNTVKVIIDRKSEKERKQIDEHIELYQWKEDNYGSPHDD